MTVIITVAVVTATPVALLNDRDEMWPLSAKAWAAVAMLSVLTGMAAHGMLYYAQHSVPISTISIIQSGQPSMSALWAWLLLGEAITVAQVPGMILVTLGLVLVFWFSLRTTPVAQAAGSRPRICPPPDVSFRGRVRRCVGRISRDAGIQVACGSWSPTTTASTASGCTSWRER